MHWHFRILEVDLYDAREVTTDKLAPVPLQGDSSQTSESEGVRGTPREITADIRPLNQLLSLLDSISRFLDCAARVNQVSTGGARFRHTVGLDFEVTFQPKHRGKQKKKKKRGGRNNALI